MVDKIIITPEKIRGLGNIIIPKNLTDYIDCNNSSLTSKETTINEIATEVFELNYYITPSIIVNAPTTSFIPYVDGQEITFPITVVDENNNRVQNVRVEWDVNNDFSGHVVTDTNGTADFEYNLATDPTTGAKSYSFTVDFEISETDHNPKVTNSVTVTTGCTLTLARTGYMED